MIWFGSYVNGLVVFPTFLNLRKFKHEFGNKEFMIWAVVSFRSCFCWLYRASPFFAAKNIINMFWYWPSGDVHVYSLLLCCWKRVFVMTSAFSWQNSISLCLASFCTPRPYLPITPAIQQQKACVPVKNQAWMTVCT